MHTLYNKYISKRYLIYTNNNITSSYFTNNVLIKINLTF